MGGIGLDGTLVQGDGIKAHPLRISTQLNRYFRDPDVECFREKVKVSCHDSKKFTNRI